MVDVLAVTGFTFIHLQWASIKMRKCRPSIMRMYSYLWFLWPCPWLKWSNRWLSLQALILFPSLNSLLQIFIYLWPPDKTSCQSFHCCSIRMFFMYTHFLANLVSSLRSTSTCECESMQILWRLSSLTLNLASLSNIMVSDMSNQHCIMQFPIT